jgi:hypothetical protein
VLSFSRGEHPWTFVVCTPISAHVRSGTLTEPSHQDTGGHDVHLSMENEKSTPEGGSESPAYVLLR